MQTKGGDPLKVRLGRIDTHSLYSLQCLRRIGTVACQLGARYRSEEQWGVAGGAPLQSNIWFPADISLCIRISRRDETLDIVGDMRSGLSKNARQPPVTHSQQGDHRLWGILFRISKRIIHVYQRFYLGPVVIQPYALVSFHNTKVVSIFSCLHQDFLAGISKIFCVMYHTPAALLS
jgi:hypothetical protein